MKGPEYVPVLGPIKFSSPQSSSAWGFQPLPLSQPVPLPQCLTLLYKNPLGWLIPGGLPKVAFSILGIKEDILG